MLPDFPKIKSEVHRDVLARIRRRADGADSVVSQIKRFSQHEGRDMRYDRVDAPPVESGPEELGAHFEVLLSDVPDLIGPKLDAKIEEIAIHWLLEVLDLPRDSGVGLVDCDTQAMFCGLAAASHAPGSFRPCKTRHNSTALKACTSTLATW